MAKTPEGKVKDKLRKLVKSHGLLYSMKVPMGYGSAGWPDFDIVAWGVFVTVETKASIKARGPTKLQQSVMQDIAASGGIPLLVDAANLDSFAKFLRACQVEYREVGYLIPQRAYFFAESFKLLCEQYIDGKSTSSTTKARDIL